MLYTLLQYDSLKTVLQYLEANLRFHLSQRLPSIRQTEKAGPLQIETLVYGHDSITVNKTRYRIDIYRHYHAPWDHTDTVDCDLNEFGVPDNLDAPLAAGDIKWGDQSNSSFSRTYIDGFEWFWIDSLNREKKRFAELQEQFNEETVGIKRKEHEEAIKVYQASVRHLSGSIRHLKNIKESCFHLNVKEAINLFPVIFPFSLQYPHPIRK